MSLPNFHRFRRLWFPQKAQGDWQIPANPDEFDVFLLMGQSNMAGYGCIAPQDPWQPGDLEPVPGVLVLGGQGTAKTARARGRTLWSPAAHPLHLNQNSAGFGLGLEFANQLRCAEPTRSIGLVPCAWGGAPISVLEPDTPLYRNSLKRARLAAKRGRLRGILWHQGESDAEHDDLASAHSGRLLKLIAALRRDLAALELPFIIGDLAPFLELSRRTSNPEAAERIATVRAGLRQAAASDPYSSFVESDGLSGVDPFHFDRASLIELGRRYALTWTR